MLGWYLRGFAADNRFCDASEERLKNFVHLRPVCVASTSFFATSDAEKFYQRGEVFGINWEILGNFWISDSRISEKSGKIEK